jgi:hypothetical protein
LPRKEKNKMPNIIQCSGFTVEPLGNLPLLISEGANVAPWTAEPVFPSAQVTIEATGETQILQVFRTKTQDDANLMAMIYGNDAVGNW